MKIHRVSHDFHHKMIFLKFPLIFLIIQFLQEEKKKGKVGTKGSKQIVEENIATLKFYRNMSLGACSIFLLVALLLKTFTTTIITMTIVTFAIHVAAYQFMRMMSRPQLTENGSILDSGTDLNLEGGIAE